MREMLSARNYLPDRSLIPGGGGPTKKRGGGRKKGGGNSGFTPKKKGGGDRKGFSHTEVGGHNNYDVVLTYRCLKCCTNADIVHSP